MVGGDESVVTPAPPHALSTRAKPTRAAGTTRAARRSPSPHHGPGAGTLVPRIQLMEARASAVVQFGRLRVVQVVHAAVVEERASVRGRACRRCWARWRRRSARGRRRRRGCSRRCGRRRRSGACPSTSRSWGAALRGRSGTPRRRASRRRRSWPACRSRGPSRPRTPSGRRRGGPPCRGPGPPWPRRRPPGRQPGGAQVALQRDEGAGDQRALVLAQGQEGGQDDDLAPQGGQGRPADRAGSPGARSGGWAGRGQALAGRRRGGRRRAAGGQEHAEGEGTATVVSGSAGERSGSGLVLPGGQEGEGEVGQRDQGGGDPAGQVVEDGTMVEGSSSCCSLKRSEPS